MQFSFITYSTVDGEDDVNGVFRIGNSTYFLVPCDSSFADCHLWMKGDDSVLLVKENEEDRNKLYELQKKEGVSRTRKVDIINNTESYRL